MLKEMMATGAVLTLLGCQAPERSEDRAPAQETPLKIGMDCDSHEFLFIDNQKDTLLLQRMPETDAHNLQISFASGESLFQPLFSGHKAGDLIFQIEDHEPQTYTLYTPDAVFKIFGQQKYKARPVLHPETRGRYIQWFDVVSPGRPHSLTL